MKIKIKQRIAQIQRGEVPEGYKIEQHAIIPGEWRRCKLGDIGEVLMCKRIYANQTSQEGEIPFYKIGTFGKNADAYITRSLYEKYKESYPYPQKGDVLISAAGTLGRIVVYDGNEAYFQDSNIVWLKVDKNIISNEYLSLYYQIIEWPIPEGSTIQRLYNGMIRKTQISIPLLSEQKNIITIIAAQDKIIELKEKLLAEKQRQKKYLMQQLLTSKKRLPGFSGEWKKVKLSTVLVERKEKKQEQELRICSVAVQKGVIDQIEHLGRSYAASNTSNYGVAYYGDIIYTKSPTGDFPYGIIKQNLLHEKVAVSPLYGIFKPMTFGMGYILHTYFQDEINAKNYLLPIIQKGAKNTINITNETFLSNALYLPLDAKEQNAIATIFATSDREINLLRQDVEQEKQKKKALMQLLLTGIVRVKT